MVDLGFAAEGLGQGSGEGASISRLKSLAEIADSFGCDKGLVGPSPRWSAQNYVDVYEALFRPLRLEPLQLLEIGIGASGDSWDARVVHGRNSGGGASLRTWAEYFPNARIHGIDINDASHLDCDRIRTYRLDQGNRQQVRSFLADIGPLQFDIVIDDGSHRADHQQVSLEMLWPRLVAGGTWFIEDLNDSDVQAEGQDPAGAVSAVSTRRLLRRFLDRGEVLTPNAFEHAGFLDQVADIVFYCPRPVLRPRDVFLEVLRVLAGRAHKGLLRTEFNPDSHRLVALRKRRGIA